MFKVALPQRKRPQVDGSVPEPVWTFWRRGKSLAYVRNQNLDHP